MKENVILMFPQSVYVSEYKHEVTEKEFDYIGDLPTRNNGPANSVSLSDQVLEAEQLKNIKDFCQENIEQYAYEVLCIKKDIKFYITQSWANYSKKGQFHQQHRHNNSIISAVFYVDQVKDSPIRFFKQEENSLFPLELRYSQYNRMNTSEITLSLEEGRVVVFPSKLLHGADSNPNDNERISISMNTFIKGHLGDIDTKTGLKL
jgi:uncharacterized protein (TIGR02466 family)